MCYVQEEGMGKNLQLSALSNLFLEAELSSLVAQICVYRVCPKRKCSQIEFLHLK